MNLRIEYSAFLDGQVGIMEKINQMDTNVMLKADLLATETITEFRTIVDSFHDQISSDIKNWKHKNTDLQSKYESTAMWMKMFSEINERLRDEFFANQSITIKHLISLHDCMHI